METTRIRGGSASETPRPRPRPFDMGIEIDFLPVSDVDRGTTFYASLGWRLDIDYRSGESLR